ncbi:hypothetical protein AAHE18_14G198400 [Arachis hypogaea]
MTLQCHFHGSPKPVAKPRKALYNPRLFCCLQSYCQSNVLEAYTRLRKVAKSFEIGNLPGLWMLCMPLFMILGFLLRRKIHMQKLLDILHMLPKTNAW